MKNSIPLCFYPTRKILLDDDKAFTQSILLKMYGKNFSAFNFVTEALKYLTQEYNPKIIKSNLISLTSSAVDSIAEHTINIQFEKLNECTLEDSNQDISILFIDYHMPDMYGIDFLKQISTLPMKKVLVTGEYDYKIAIDAFNNGLIDAYIRKSEPDFLSKLQHIASELEWQYFIDLSQVVYDLPEFDYLKNKHLINFFTQFITDKNITNFHLIDKQGTFHTRNILDEKEYIIFRNIMQLQQLSEFAAEDGASEKTVNDLAQGKVIPFFNFKEPWEIPAYEWNNYLYSANKLPGDPAFLWTKIK